LVTEIAQYSALRCVSDIWQNNEKPLISNVLRFIVTCLPTAALWVLFHTSRHTFASTVTLANNISLEVVSKMLGHTNTRMTNHYAKLIDKCIGEQMDKLMDTFTGDSNY
jgi:site-specific recombinase XerD